jgi:uncharacterized membrane protein
MILFIASLLTRFFGIDLQKAQRAVLVALIAVGVVIFLVIFGLVYRSCSSKSAKVDLETVDKINDGNKAEVRKEVRELVEENAEVVTTVDNRTTIAETNVVERERVLDEKVRVVEQKIAEAKSIDGNVSQEDLQCALVPSDCQ